jgi:hypothetical protein
MLASILGVAIGLPAAADFLAGQASARADLSGTWIMVGWEADGQRIPLVMVGSVMRLDLKKGTYHRTFSAGLAGGSTEKGDVEVVGAAGKRVLKIDLEYMHTGSVGESNREVTTTHVERAIAEVVDKDTLRMCATEGKVRPDGFTTKKGDGRRLLVFQRKKE